MQFPIIIGLHRSRFLDGAIAIALILLGAVAWAFPGQIAIRLTLAALGVVLAILAWQQLTPKYGRCALSEMAIYRLNRSSLRTSCRLKSCRRQASIPG